MRLRRFEEAPSKNPKRLPMLNSAAVQGTTIYKKRVIHASLSKRLLKSGIHSKKIGGFVVKGRWSGMPIYTLTLEERATCPRSCRHWFDCYGNKMNWSERIIADNALVDRLDHELLQLSRLHPNGFVVRLHVLGDFFSVEYVQSWRFWLAAIPQLHIFGYTAWHPLTPIGADIARLNGDRFWVRFSDGPLYELRTGEDGIVCPAMTGDTDCCGTCGLCWTTEKAIYFPDH